MALQISEKWESGGNGSFGKDGHEEYSANVWGDPNPAGDNADNKLAILAFALPHFQVVSPLGYVFSDVVPERKGPGSWVVTANYKTLENNRQTNDASFSFTSGGGTTHITHSIKTVGAYLPMNAPSGSIAPNHHNAINVDNDGNVNGTDVFSPTFSFKITQYMSSAAMSGEFIQQLKTTIPSVNSDQMDVNIDGLSFQFQPGEILVHNADGQKRIGFGDWELSLSFAQSNNLTDIVIGANVDGSDNPRQVKVANKKGWDFLWVDTSVSTDSLDNNGNPATSIVSVPGCAYVEQIYQYNPLSQLIQLASFGIGNEQPWLDLGPYQNNQAVYGSGTAYLQEPRT